MREKKFVPIQKAIFLLIACFIQMPAVSASSRRQMLALVASRGRRRFWCPQTGRSSRRLYSIKSDNEDPTETSRLISYLTDVEGDREYLSRFVEQSRVLTFRPIAQDNLLFHETSQQTTTSTSITTPFPYDHCIDFINENDMLVFGGDAWDQGGSDLYVIRQLLDLKERYFDRVHLVVGNRDVNKMRMSRELGSLEDIAAPPHQGVYWLTGTGREGDPSSGVLLSDDPVRRLQWMLRDTMGSPKAFEHRRLELEQERLDLGQSDPVSDFDILDSYKKSTDPMTGEMSRYLSQAELAVKLGDILFIHGALPLTQSVVEAHGDAEESIWSDMTFAMPWLPSGMRARCDTLYEWFSRVNYFLHDSVNAWKIIEPRSEDPLWAVAGGYRRFPSYSNLVQYGMGGLPGGRRGDNPTIIYQGWATDGMPRRFFENSEGNNHHYRKHVRDFFQRADLQLIMSGHQPQGDTANVIRVDIPGESRPAFIVCADTSYSGDTKWHSPDSSDATDRLRLNKGRGTARSGRGNVAVTEVLIEQSQRTSRVVDVFSHGVLSDGSRFETLGLFQEQRTDLVVGTVASGLIAPPPLDGASPWWTRAAFNDGSFLLSTGKGFDSWNHILNKPNEQD